jgi:hypothetical protein
LLFYLPRFPTLYGPGSLAEPGVFADRFNSLYWNWSVLNWLPMENGPPLCLGLWAASAMALVLGWQTKFAAIVAWSLSLSFYNTNFYLHNSGDRIRHFLLLLLIIAPTDGAWSVGRRRHTSEGAVYVPGWPVCVILVQMYVMYLTNGIYKMQGRVWWEGNAMHYVNRDIVWSRWSPIPMPDWMSRCLTWFTLLWETGFPIWYLWRRTRTVALIIGVIFHVVTFFQLEIAAFGLYALCLYLPLAPWERLSRHSRSNALRAVC